MADDTIGIRNFIDKEMIHNTLFVCENCKKTMTVKYSEKWFALQCRCRHALFYATGHFTVIPKKIYLLNKEREVVDSDKKRA